MQPASDNESDGKVWLAVLAAAQIQGDREVLKVLRAGLRALNAQLATMRTYTPSEALRREQIMTVKRALLREQAKIMTAAARIADEQRMAAAVAATQLGVKDDTSFFKEALAMAVATGAAAWVIKALKGWSSRTRMKELEVGLIHDLDPTLRAGLTRMYGPQLPLSVKVRRINDWLSGRVDRMVEGAIQNDTPVAEVARKARDWLSPNTPGGVRYAAERTVRTEANNAFHVVTVEQSREKPWIHQLRWNLSESHPRVDKCDLYAKHEGFGHSPGLFLPDWVPPKPHPNCLCYLTPVALNPDAFLNMFALGRYNAYLRSRTGNPVR